MGNRMINVNAVWRATMSWEELSLNGGTGATTCSCVSVAVVTRSRLKRRIRPPILKVGGFTTEKSYTWAYRLAPVHARGSLYVVLNQGLNSQSTYLACNVG